jgi:uncharacterized protein (DUF58 family)
MFRRLQLAILAIVLVVAAFSTGRDFLFFLLYLGLLVVGGAYLVTRFGLADLEAGYAIDRLHAQVGENLSVTYTIRNAGRLPKLWLEVNNPSTLPVPLPGRALFLGSRGERSWIARVPLTLRGHYRVDPLHIRTGDPFGFFEASATVGSGVGVTVYPRVEPLPRWRLPATSLEGTHASPERTLQTTPLVTSVRPYAPGDAYNRIHWKSTARQGELQVKEFDLEQTADAWVFLDLDRSVQTGSGEESTLEAGVRAAASIAARALVENRAVGFTAASHRTTVLPADRGGRQHQKIMALLAAVRGDGDSPFVEVLIQGLGRLRRGMTAVVITPSLERDWVRPLAALRSRGVACVVVHLDAIAYEDRQRALRRLPAAAPQTREAELRAQRAVRHALAEYDIVTHVVVPGRPLGEQLASAAPAAIAGVRT